MKLLLCFTCCIIFSSCGLISVFKISDAMQAERMVTHSFKQEIPFREEKGMLVVEAIVEGKVCKMIFDTGANTIIDDDVAKNLHYKKVGIRKSKDSANKKKTLKIVKFQNFMVGQVAFAGIVSAISDIDPLKKAMCGDFDGILGANVMNKGIWQIDYKRKVITMTDSRDSLPKYPAAKIFSFFAEGKKTPKIRLTIHDQYIGEAILDTGSSGGLSFPTSILPNMPTADSSIRGIGLSSGLFSETTNTFQTTTTPTLTLGKDFTLTKPFVTFSSQLPMILIGNEFLRDYLVTIDWKYQEITLANFQPSEKKRFYIFGFAPSLKDGKLMVASLTQNSAATNAGIALHDQILQVNELDFRQANHKKYCELMELWNKSDSLSITLKKQEKEVQVQLKKTNLLEKLTNSQ